MSAPLQSAFPLFQTKYFDISVDRVQHQRNLLNVHMLVLSGKHENLLTSILQQAAVSYSSAGKSTVFIRPEPLTRLPLSVHGKHEMNYATVQNVKYMYIRTAKDLMTYLCGINNTDINAPKVIIVDGFDYYTRQLQFTSDICIAQLCSLLSDTVKYLQERYADMVPVLLSVSDTLIAHLYVYNRYFKVYTLEKQDKQGGADDNKDDEVFLLEQLHSSLLDVETFTSVKYRLTLAVQSSSLTLEKLEALQTKMEDNS